MWIYVAVGVGVLVIINALFVLWLARAARSRDDGLRDERLLDD